MKNTKVTSRQKILIATRDLLWEHGVKGTTTNRIAEKAGVNAVTVFRIFKSKENLLWDVLTEVSGTELAKLAEVLRRDFGSLEDFFSALNATFLESFLPMHKTFSAIMSEDDDPENIFCPFVGKVTSEVINSIAAKLAGLNKQGILRDVDFLELSLLHFNYCLGSSMLTSAHDKSFTGKVLEKSVATMTQILINGLRP